MAEKKQLIQQLQGYISNMAKAVSQVSQVLQDLANVKITAEGTNSFKVSGLSGNIGVAEHNAVYGDAESPPGGLSKIMSTIRGDMQDYTNTNTTQQYNMELIMTSVQQMYSLTTTCITTLNQSYMSFARAIYK